MNKCLPFGAKIAKIGPADPEIICLPAIIKKKKLTQAKYIDLPASLPSGLNSIHTVKICQAQFHFELPSTLIEKRYKKV